MMRGEWALDSERGVDDRIALHCQERRQWAKKSIERVRPSDRIAAVWGLKAKVSGVFENKKLQ